MKRYLIVLLFLPLFSFAQQYSEVVEIPGKTANQLYKSTKDWIAITFNSSKDVIQLEDTVQKKIIAKGIKKVTYYIGKVPIVLDMSFTLIIQFKDGRFKSDINSNEIYNTVGNQQYTYEQFKSLTTEEGIKSVYKSAGNNQIQKMIESNKTAVAEIEKQLQSVVTELTVALKKEDKTTNW